MTCRSTGVPCCLVYFAARSCQNGRVWSLLYSAITTLIAARLPNQSPQAARPKAARAISAIATRGARDAAAFGERTAGILPCPAAPGAALAAGLGRRQAALQRARGVRRAGKGGAAIGTSFASGPRRP